LRAGFLFFPSEAESRTPSPFFAYQLRRPLLPPPRNRFLSPAFPVPGCQEPMKPRLQNGLQGGTPIEFFFTGLCISEYLSRPLFLTPDTKAEGKTQFTASLRCIRPRVSFFSFKAVSFFLLLGDASIFPPGVTKQRLVFDLFEKEMSRFARRIFALFPSSTPALSPRTCMIEFRRTPPSPLEKKPLLPILSFPPPRRGQRQTYFT